MTRKAPGALDALELGLVFGTFAAGVAVVTTRMDDGVPHGAAASAFTAVSLDPPLAQITLSRTSRSARYLADARFAINILSLEQKGVARHFTGGTPGEEPEWILNGSVPVLARNAATLECRPWNIYDGGDHVIVIGEVTALEVTAREPLVILGGRFRKIADSPEDAGRGGDDDAPSLGWLAGSSVRRAL